MDRYTFPLARIGIVGGGQLGKMFAQEAKKLCFSVTVLDPSPTSPACQLADHVIVASYFDEAKLRELADGCDVLTYELENIDTRTLKAIRAGGREVHPDPAILEIIQDKLAQKEFLARHGIPTAKFTQVDRPTPEAFAEFGYPLVQKARRGGYDGRGVQILQGEEDFPRALPAESMLEAFVEVDRELAVIVARGREGDVRCYPVVEMVFDSEANILDHLVTPAGIPAAQAEEARKLAIRVIEVAGGVGVFGVEMFLAKNGELLVNEVSPRPHNSGHYTIEACLTSQYEQHLRAIAGLPLGDTDLLWPAVMVNLLGTGRPGRPVVTGLREALAVPGATIHLYGKDESRPHRKMGHAVVMDKDLDKAREKAQLIRSHLRIFGE